MTHTPGPWKITSCRDRKFPYVIQGGPPLSDAVDYSFNPCAIYGDGTENRGVALANARLIAAAPDLLSAAQAMLAKLEKLTVAEFERGGERAERDALAKAITKACQS